MSCLPGTVQVWWESKDCGRDEQGKESPARTERDLMVKNKQQEVPFYTTEETEEVFGQPTFRSDLRVLFVNEGFGRGHLQARRF